MRKCIKFTSTLFLILFLILTATRVSAHSYNLFVNHNYIEEDLLKENNRILVPMRAIFEAMDAKVDWNQKEGKVLASKGDKKIILIPSKNYVEVDGKEIKLDVPPKIVNDKTMVPVRFIAETLGADVTWYQQTGTVSILDEEYTDKYKYPYDLSKEEVEKILQFENKDFMETLYDYISTYQLVPERGTISDYYMDGAFTNQKSYLWLKGLNSYYLEDEGPYTLEDAMKDKQSISFIEKEMFIVDLTFYADEYITETSNHPTLYIVQEEDGSYNLIEPYQDITKVEFDTIEDTLTGEPIDVVNYTAVFSSSPELNNSSYINYKLPADLVLLVDHNKDNPKFSIFKLDFNKY